MNSVATDVPREPVEAIRNYGLHALDVGYVQVVFDTFGIEAIGTTLETIVHRGERAEISDGLSFLEDTIRFAMHREFALWYVRFPLLQAVRDMVCGPDALGRHLAMYTMARGGPAANGRVLADAVPWYLEHDLLGLSDLLYNLHIFGPRYRRADYDFVRANGPSSPLPDTLVRGWPSFDVDQGESASEPDPAVPENTGAGSESAGSYGSALGAG